MCKSIYRENQCLFNKEYIKVDIYLTYSVSVCTDKFKPSSLNFRQEQSELN